MEALEIVERTGKQSQILPTRQIPLLSDDEASDSVFLNELPLTWPAADLLIPRNDQPSVGASYR